MSVNPHIPNVFYLSKAPLYSIGEAKNKLILKKINPNSSPGKINKLILEKRLVSLEGPPKSYSIKIDSKWMDMLKKHSFDGFAIKHSSKKDDITSIHGSIQSLNSNESTELQQAVDDYLHSVAAAREEVEAKGDDKKKRLSRLPPRPQQRQKAPSQVGLYDYLVLLIPSKERSSFAANLQEEQRKSDRAAKEDEEKRDEIKRAILKKDIERWDLRQDNIKEEELS
ncbi:MAG: hypothetical protein ACSNEK_08540 [Parachlamydiaceae bacterium]